MTNLEKMLKGEYYYADDKQLVELRRMAKDLCLSFNSEVDPLLRNEKLKKLLGSFKGEFKFTPSIHFDYGFNVHLGANFYANANLVILDGAKVSFGDNVFIAPNCGVYTAIHPLDPKERNKGLEKALAVTIGNNVWIGGGVNILPGVKIGDNSTIGAGSVVTKDIPADVLAFGNPCKVIRKLWH